STIHPASVRQDSRWRTDLFSPLNPQAIYPRGGEWRLRDMDKAVGNAGLVDDISGDEQIAVDGHRVGALSGVGAARCFERDDVSLAGCSFQFVDSRSQC